jgi:hypothetical protein
MRSPQKILPQSLSLFRHMHHISFLDLLLSHQAPWSHIINRSQATNTMTSKPRTIEDWLFVLKHRYYYHDHVADPSDPYSKAVSSYQAFIESIVDGLERKDLEVISLVNDRLFEYFFHETFLLPSAKHFQYWLKDAMLKHPLRRCPRQHVTLALVRAQDCREYRTVKSKVLAAVNDYIEWKGLAYDPEALVKDPSSTYFLRNKNGNKEVSTSDSSNAQANDACLICTDGFDDKLHLAQRAPCGHIICRACFDNWLLKCEVKFTCPLCRACVVCGANDCKHHDIRQDIVPPVPLPDVLDKLTSSPRGQVLHGLEPNLYLCL